MGDRTRLILYPGCIAHEPIALGLSDPEARERKRRFYKGVEQPSSGYDGDGG